MKYILLTVCGNKEAVVEEILNWAGNGEDDMEFKYNIIKAFEDERAEGKEEGQMLKMISLVRKKLHKRIEINEIADMLEEEAAVIEPIYELLQNHAEWDDERICRELAASREGIAAVEQGNGF